MMTAIAVSLAVLLMVSLACWYADSGNRSPDTVASDELQDKINILSAEVSFLTSQRDEARLELEELKASVAKKKTTAKPAVKRLRNTKT